MVEYITKEQAIEAAWTLELYNSERDELEEEINAISAADVAPLIHTTTSGGYWEEIYCKWKFCDNCHGENVFAADYCNWCGARLDGEER